jgi:hypothetical protein
MMLSPYLKEMALSPDALLRFFLPDAIVSIDRTN